MRDPKKTVYVYGVPEYGKRPKRRTAEVASHYGGARTRDGDNCGFSMSIGDLGWSFAIEITYGIDNLKDVWKASGFCDYLASNAMHKDDLDFLLKPLIDDMLAAGYDIEEIAKLLAKCPENCILPRDFPVDIMAEQIASSEFDL